MSAIAGIYLLDNRTVDSADLANMIDTTEDQILKYMSSGPIGIGASNV